MKSVILALSLLLLSGCAMQTTHTLVNPSQLAAPGATRPTHATVYVMRDSSLAAVVYPINIWVDGERKAALYRQTYVQLELPPGQHLIAAKRNMLSAVPAIAVLGRFEANKTYYLMTGTGYHGFGGYAQFSAYFRQISPQEAKTPLATFAATLPIGGATFADVPPPAAP